MLDRQVFKVFHPETLTKNQNGMEKMVVDKCPKGEGIFWEIFQGGNIFPTHVHNACKCMELDCNSSILWTIGNPLWKIKGL